MTCAPPPAPGSCEWRLGGWWGWCAPGRAKAAVAGPFVGADGGASRTPRPAVARGVSQGAARVRGPGVSLVGARRLNEEKNIENKA